LPRRTAGLEPPARKIEEQKGPHHPVVKVAVEIVEAARRERAGRLGALVCVFPSWRSPGAVTRNAVSNSAKFVFDHRIAPLQPLVSRRRLFGHSQRDAPHENPHTGRHFERFGARPRLHGHELREIVAIGVARRGSGCRWNVLLGVSATDWREAEEVWR
jgi:hypothetical protein